MALFIVLFCCFSAVSASESVDDSVAVSDDVAMDEVVAEVDSGDESLSVQENEELESSDDDNNESLEVQDVEQVDDVDDSNSALAIEENDNDIALEDEVETQISVVVNPSPAVAGYPVSFSRCCWLSCYC